MRPAGRLITALAGVALILGACGNDDAGPPDTSYPPPSTTSSSAASPTATTQATGSSGPNTPTPTASPSPSGSATAEATARLDQESESTAPDAETSRDGPSLVLTPVASSTDPIALAARPDTGSGSGDLYVATRPGKVWLLGADHDEPPELVLDISDRTNTGCEEGLLGITFSPDGSKLYLNYTDRSGNSRIVEYPMSGQWVETDRERLVLDVEQPACNHNGGHITFGPDGLLWAGFGDGGGADDRYGHGQNPDSLLGTLIRIDPEATGPSDYAIPADNPFVDGEGRPEIWAYGARNPWRFSFDRETDDLWVGDVGQNAWEEIHVLPASRGWEPGSNLGWPLFEGNERFSGTTTPDDLVFPIYAYGHSDGCSVTGGYVYRGSAIPSLVGTYVFGDFCRGQVWGLITDDQGEAVRVDLGISVADGTLVSFGEDASGELYVLSFDGKVYRIDGTRD